MRSAQSAYEIEGKVECHVNAKNLTYRLKPVWFAVAPLLGVKNGQIAGMR